MLCQNCSGKTPLLATAAAPTTRCATETGDKIACGFTFRVSAWIRRLGERDLPARQAAEAAYLERHPATILLTQAPPSPAGLFLARPQAAHG